LAEIPRLDHAADAEGARGAALAGMSAPADGAVARHFGQGRGEHAIPLFPEPAGFLGTAKLASSATPDRPEIRICT
jgi:hypothetical protein